MAASFIRREIEEQYRDELGALLSEGTTNILGYDDGYGWTTCRICEEQCFIEYDPVLKSSPEDTFLDVIAIICPNCHLQTPRRYTDLARLHWGRLSADTIGSDGFRSLLDDLGHE